MASLEGMAKMIARLGPKGRKGFMTITIIALFLLNLNGALAAGSASIGDYVWDDQNDDGKQDSEFDVGINGVVIELHRDGIWQENSITQNDPVTGDPGWYLFENLGVGNYVVKVADSNFESGGALYDYALTTESNLLSVYLGEGDAHSEADFGYVALASPGGPGGDAEPTAVTLSSFAASSTGGGDSPWPWLAALATLAAGGTLWIRQQ